MKNHRHFRWYAARTTLCAVALGCSLLSRAEVIDRIVATVNRHAILESEWDEAVAFECLMNGRPLQEMIPADRTQTLDRLIDQELIAEQMNGSSFVPAKADEIVARVRELRQTVPAWKTDDGWEAALASYGLTEEDVEERVAIQVNLSRYLDLRFRPGIHIERRAMEEYYRQKLLPEMRASGWPDKPFDQLAPQIEQLLTEQRMNELQDDWLRSLRLQADIQRR
ncbi:MAG TPA: hypothetical protein VEE85_01170 [Candidatus Bathyarchaeia archaeon]|nr:hypothetical protein [Candidatus Bathyarchaeia archaeon]